MSQFSLIFTVRVELLLGIVDLGVAGLLAHRALELGELRPDYIFFGRFGQDTHPAPYRKNVALAEWWAANKQQADGSIRVPEALEHYMGGIEVIRAA